MDERLTYLGSCGSVLARTGGRGQKIDLLRELWKRQRGCCYYTNIPMSWGHLAKMPGLCLSRG